MERLDFFGKYFFDTTSGRVVQFRGVNFGGDAKLPVGGNTSIRDGIFDIELVTYIGKPVPLDEADEHCRRQLNMGGRGFMTRGLLVPAMRWLRRPELDALFGGLRPPPIRRHRGCRPHFAYDPPDAYPTMIWPTNYAKLAAATMFTLFFGGETFAPKCTIPSKAGGLVNIQTYLQGAFCEAYKYLFTCLKGVGLLDSVVVGIDTLNEPSEGFIETEDITALPLFSLTSTRNGASPTVLQALLLGEGHSCRVDTYPSGSLGFVKLGTVQIEPNGIKAWFKEGESIRPNLAFPPWQEWQTSGRCIWALNGVWDPATLQPKRKDYFAYDPVTRRKYDFLSDFWKPFVAKFAHAIRSVSREAIIFLNPPVNLKPPPFTGDEIPTGRLVYSPHWYDGKTLLTLHYSWWTFDYLGYLRKRYWFIGQAVKVGEASVRKCFQEMIALIQAEGREAFGETPCLIGECGIPFNLDNQAAYTTGDYSQQVRALDATLNATEQTGVYCTIWNYAANNNNREGDRWNREDLSIFSRDVQLAKVPSHFFLTELDRGGRALEAVVRPYAAHVPGLPHTQTFLLPQYAKTGAPAFHLRFRPFPATALAQFSVQPLPECEIFLPIHHFPPAKGLNVSVSEGTWEVVRTPLRSRGGAAEAATPMLQSLIWKFDTLLPDSLYTIRVTHAGALFPPD
ncbi:hypothetical protein L0F63_004935 [Massospora cicadina]|nr:hypothetical protein L0F63_004935 [Massospora cicadina]